MIYAIESIFIVVLCVVHLVRCSIPKNKAHSNHCIQSTHIFYNWIVFICHSNFCYFLFFVSRNNKKKTNQTKKKTRYKIQNYCVVFVNAICEVSQCFVQFRIDIYSSRIAIWQREVVHNKEGKKTKCVVHFQLIFDRGVYQLKLNRLKSHPMIMVNMIYFFSVNRLLLATFYRWKSFTQHI